MRTAEFWAEVRRIRAGLPEWLWMTKPGGAVCQVGRENAGVMLASGTMRAATAEEIEAHQARARIRAQAYQAGQAAQLRTAVVSDGGKR